MSGTITETSNGGVMMDGAGAIEVYRLASLISALKLQKAGIRMSSRIPQATTICRKQYGLKGSIDKLIPQVQALLELAKSQVTYKQE
jgi:hypothetical protein